jgi:hypothetical protein
VAKSHHGPGPSSIFNLQFFFFNFLVSNFKFLVFYRDVFVLGAFLFFYFSKKLKTKNEVGNSHSIGQTTPKANHAPLAAQAGQSG